LQLYTSTVKYDDTVTVVNTAGNYIKIHKDNKFEPVLIIDGIAYSKNRKPLPKETDINLFTSRVDIAKQRTAKHPKERLWKL